VFIRQAILKGIKLERHVLDNGTTRLPPVISDIFRERLEILNNLFSPSLIQEAMVYRDLSIEPAGFPSTEATIDVIWCLYPSLMTTVRRRAAAVSQDMRGASACSHSVHFCKAQKHEHLHNLICRI